MSKPRYRDFNEYFRVIAPSLWNVKEWNNEIIKYWLENAFLDARIELAEPQDRPQPPNE